jgi:hypothetical protein
MLIPDRILPHTIAHSAAAFGAVLLAIAVDVEAAKTKDIGECVRDEMSPQRMPRILAHDVADTMRDPHAETGKILCYWNATVGFDLVMRWYGDERQVEAWIIVSGKHVLHTKDLRSVPFEAHEKHTIASPIAG